MPPETMYTRVGDGYVAYQVFGEGEVDLIAVGGPASHLETWWENQEVTRYFERLGSFCRVALYDRRGTGLSDPIEGMPTLEAQMEDMAAVCEAAGFDKPSLWGAGEGGRSALLYAATFPDKVSRMVLFGVSIRGAVVVTPEVKHQLLDLVENSWGKGELVRFFSPSRADDPVYKKWWGKLERNSVSPGMARKLADLAQQVDVSDIIPAVHPETLVLHRRDDVWVPFQQGAEVATALPNAKFVALEGTDNSPWTGDSDALLDEVEEFLTGHRSHREPERVLATVLFADIVDSTRAAAELGDQAWRARLDHYVTRAREALERHRGREIKTTGDGILATFDGPARAVRAAREIVGGSGLDARAGLHTGEIELTGEDIAGLAVHIAARVMAEAGPREVLVSRTVRDLVVGSGLAFEDRGEHSLRGVPDTWDLFALGA